MAHDLNIKDGQAAMMYVEEAPWHGLGTRLAKPATAREAIHAAHLDWEVEKTPLLVMQNQRLRETKSYAVVRKDFDDEELDPVLGIVGEDYTPLQNREAFEFFDPIVGMDAAIYHTAGALGKGERIWILAKLPSDIRVIGEDIAEKYLLLSNSHDGKSSVQIKFTPIRVVCQNTLNIALREGRTLNVAHRRDLHWRLRDATVLLRIIHHQFDSIEEVFKSMACVRMNQQRLDQYLGQVYPSPRDQEDFLALERTLKNRFRAEQLFVHGSGNDLPGVSGTLWAAYNGVTELIDHRGTRQDPDQRLNSVWFGDGYLTKARAYRVAKEKLMEWRN